MHLSTAAVVNAVWDLWAKTRRMPLWRLLADLSPEEIVRASTSATSPTRSTPDEACRPAARAQRRGATSASGAARATAIPAYTTSAGWLGYDDEKVERLVHAGAGRRVPPREDEGRRGPRRRHAPRARSMREAIGRLRTLMMDANQVWDVGEAIAAMRELAAFDPWWIEEPTSPDDVLGHARIRARDRADRVATGEHVPEPHRLQAAAPGKRDRLLPDRRVPCGGRQRGDRDPSAGGEVRRAGVSRTRAASASASTFSTSRSFDYLRVSASLEGPRRRVGRSPARALRASGRGRGRPLRPSAGARLQHRDARVDARGLCLPARPTLVGRRGAGRLGHGSDGGIGRAEGGTRGTGQIASIGSCKRPCSPCGLGRR